MHEFRGRYYDGHSSTARDVEIRFYLDGVVSVEGEGVSLRLRSDELRASQRLGGTNRVLTLAEGGSVELPDSDALDAILTPLGRRSGRALWLLESRWAAVALALVLTVGALGAFIQYGIPELARYAAHALPDRADRALGEETLDLLDERVFEPSQLGDAERERVELAFAHLDRTLGAQRPVRLELRGGGGVGANAFALPSGIVLVTDELVDLMDEDAELAGVLAHELGHIEHRHALRSVLQDAGVMLLVSGALGDVVSVTSIAGTLPAVMLKLQYSRRFEREADVFGADLAERAGYEREGLASALEKLAGAIGDGFVPGYLSSHPATEERARSIRGL